MAYSLKEAEEKINSLYKERAAKLKNINTLTQEIAERKRLIDDPSTSKGTVRWTQGRVDKWMGRITKNKEDLARIEERISNVFSEIKDGVSFEVDPKVPGVLLCSVIRETLALHQTILVDHEKEHGISASISKDSIRSAGGVEATQAEEPLELVIKSSLNGAFEFPEDIVAASPAYLIETSSRVATTEGAAITLRIQHYANLDTEEDCRNMIFLTAAARPVYREDKNSPVYEMKEVEGARGDFSRGERNFGEIKVSRLGCWFMIGRRRTPELWNWYSARLYKAAGGGKAVFCMCLQQNNYIKHCDEFVLRSYKDMIGGEEGRIVSSALSIVANKVTFKKHSTKCSLTMDKSTISKKEIDLPEIAKRSFSQLSDYPPRVVISVKVSDIRQAQWKIMLKGLAEECSFTVRPDGSPGVLGQQYSKSTSTIDNGHIGAAGSAPPLTARTINLLKWRTEQGEERSFRLVNMVSDRWRMMGTLLGFHPNQLDAWRTEALGDVTQCWNKVMEKWLLEGAGDDRSREEYPTTWEGVSQLLRDTEQVEVARELNDALASIAATSLSSAPDGDGGVGNGEVRGRSLEGASTSTRRPPKGKGCCTIS